MRRTYRDLMAATKFYQSVGDKAFSAAHKGQVEVLDFYDDKMNDTMDQIAKGSGVKEYDRAAHRQGYNPGQDEAKYDAFHAQAGGPVVAPNAVYNVKEGYVATCRSCGGVGCAVCDSSGYALEPTLPTNSVVLKLRENLNVNPVLFFNEEGEVINEMTMQDLAKIYGGPSKDKGPRPSVGQYATAVAKATGKAVVKTAVAGAKVAGKAAFSGAKKVAKAMNNPEEKEAIRRRFRG